MVLGINGSSFVAKRFNDFEQARQRVRPDLNCRRVLITGFGLFKGIESNISGALVKALSNSTIYNQTQSLCDRPSVSNGPVGPHGRVRSSLGVDQAYRLVVIDGVCYQLSLMVVDVLWEFAAAVIASELSHFQPHGVIMMGQGRDELVLESGAKNSVCRLPGFDTNGVPLGHNTPVSTFIADQEPDELAMTWKNRFLAERIESIARNLGYKVKLPLRSRDKNVYICNNVSYWTLMALRGRALNLAGGKIRLANYRYVKVPKIGFLHLPQRDRIPSQELSQWLHLVTRLIYYGPV